EEENGTANILNSKDLSALPILPGLIETGVRALKIEGRNKSVNYVATTVAVYRAAIDRYCANPAGYVPEDWWFEELDKLDHRPYTTGFYGGEQTLQAVFNPKQAAAYRVVALVREICDDGFLILDVKNPFDCGDVFSVLTHQGARTGRESVMIQSCFDCNNVPLRRAVTNRLVRVMASVPLAPGDILRKEGTMP
ncbi:MAG: U32 family peptidase, partial [Chitinivibrionales bacterium]|nr:U32 family peptidase [Chitinivibrionales bacterium]